MLKFLCQSGEGQNCLRRSLPDNYRTPCWEREREREGKSREKPFRLSSVKLVVLHRCPPGLNVHQWTLGMVLQVQLEAQMSVKSWS